MAGPRSGDWLEDEVAGWARSGIGTVVSLLEAHEVRELGLWDEAALCEERDIEFVAFPMPDRGVPYTAHTASNLVRPCQAFE